jgi:nitrilase
MNLPIVAAIQMVSGKSVDDNLASAKRLITEAVEQGAKLVVLPETFAQFSSREQQALGEKEASENALVRPFMHQLAKALKVWVVAGTIPVADNLATKVSSRCFVINDCGEELAYYDKIHLFDVSVADKQGSYRESDTFSAGDKVVVVDTPFGRLGVAVCYDIRFPEFFRVMFSLKVDIIAVPSAFTLSTGQAHWLPLLRARAIENQCYIIGANQGGQHTASRSTSGGSVIIEGWGGVLSELEMGEGVALAEVDLTALHKQRQAMPIDQHQHFEVIKKTV